MIISTNQGTCKTYKLKKIIIGRICLKIGMLLFNHTVAQFLKQYMSQIIPDRLTNMIKATSSFIYNGTQSCQQNMTMAIYHLYAKSTLLFPTVPDCTIKQIYRVDLAGIELTAP